VLALLRWRSVPPLLAIPTVLKTLPHSVMPWVHHNGERSSPHGLSLVISTPPSLSERLRGNFFPLLRPRPDVSNFRSDVARRGIVIGSLQLSLFDVPHFLAGWHITPSVPFSQKKNWVRNLVMSLTECSRIPVPVLPPWPGKFFPNVNRSQLLRQC